MNLYPMNLSDQLLVFRLDDNRYAMNLSHVERVIRTVEITPLPKAPDIALGIINFHGRIIPVLDIRKRFGLPPRETSLNDQLIIANTSRRMVALEAEEVAGLIDNPDRVMTQASDIMHGTDYISGVTKTGDGMVLIHDLDTFLSIEEDDRLGNAITEAYGK